MFDPRDHDQTGFKHVRFEVNRKLPLLDQKSDKGVIQRISHELSRGNPLEFRDKARIFDRIYRIRSVS
jgi:hypothetical protein